MLFAISSIGVLKSCCGMLHYMIITQLFLQPQLVPHIAQVDVQPFLQPQLVSHTAHSRYSTVSSASACTSHNTGFRFDSRYSNVSSALARTSHST